MISTKTLVRRSGLFSFRPAAILLIVLNLFLAAFGWENLATADPAPATPRPSSLRPARLRTEYKENPLGLQETAPRFFWRLESADASTTPSRGVRQSAYQVLVASSPEKLAADQGDLWDSGKVVSSETIQVAYAGQALHSRQEGWWKVRAYDQNDQPSAWSEPASFTLGLLAPGDWQARWIGYDAAPATGTLTLDGLKWVWYPEGDPRLGAPKGRRFFRKAITLPVDMKRGRAVITADDQFTLYFNGAQLARGGQDRDAWRTPHQIETGQPLKAGDYMLAIMAVNRTDGPAGLAGKLVLDLVNGQTLTIPIDGSWKSFNDRLPDWNKPAFNDSAWLPAREVATMGDAPWGMVTVAQTPPPPLLRKAFIVAKPVRRAIVYASALGLYELRLNGQRVVQDYFTPGWTDYRKRVYYQAYDVTGQLKAGENAMGALLAPGWYAGRIAWTPGNNYGTQLRLLAQLQLDYADGTNEVIATDGSWKGANGPLAESDLLNGETWDATKEPAGWDSPGFNETGWVAATVQAEPLKAVLEAHPGVPVRKTQELPPRTLNQPQPGVFVYDLGQNMTGWARLRVAGPAGTRVTIRYAEMLNPDGTLYTTNLRSARATDHYTLKGAGTDPSGQETWEPRFTYHGFRYIELTGFPGEPTLDSVTGIVVHSAIEPAGTFECSNPAINQLVSNIRWGQRSNYFEVPTDCPQRDERLGWTGDAQIFIRTGSYMADVAPFFTKWLVDLEDTQSADGAYGDVAPIIGDLTRGGPAWADAPIVCPWTVWQVYGDKRIIERHWPAMRRYLDFVKGRSKDGLSPGGGYGDWVAVGSDTPKEVLNTACFARIADLMAQMATAIGKTDDATTYTQLAGQVRAAFVRAYVESDGKIKGDTQTEYTLALAWDLLPENLRPLAVEHLVDNIKAHDGLLTTGFVGVRDLCPTLTRYGHSDVAWQLMLNDRCPSWLFEVKNGATTIWERWDSWTPEKGFQDAGMNSFNHYAFGAIGQWLYATAGGIDTAAPGFGELTIRPEPGDGLTWAKTSYESLRGKIATAWSIEGGNLKLDVTIPPGVSGRIYVPAKGPEAVTESNQPAAAAPGLKFEKLEGNAAVYQAGSGEYHFVSTGWAAK